MPASRRSGPTPKRVSVAAQTKVTPENLRNLGLERLADLLFSVAETRADLKRRLRMELAALSGPGPLAAAIDKRVTAIGASRGKVSWRQGPAFLRDLDAVRDLIAGRLASLDAPAAVERLWAFMDTAAASARRYRERGDELDRIYAAAAADLGALLTVEGPGAASLVERMRRSPSPWASWLPPLLAAAPPAFAAEALRCAAQGREAGAPLLALIRRLAEAAGDVDALRATYPAAALKAPHLAAELARRFQAAGRLEDVRDLLLAAAPAPPPTRGRRPLIDPDWEGAWIDYLEAAGRAQEAQDARWAAFERTLSSAHARAFMGRLADFDDVEAANRAFAFAAAHRDADLGLRFLMDWPALGEASAMIAARAQDLGEDPHTAELWAARLRRRFPAAARRLLLSAAAKAFARRAFQVCDRLTLEAEDIARQDQDRAEG